MKMPLALVLAGAASLLSAATVASAQQSDARHEEQCLSSPVVIEYVTIAGRQFPLFRIQLDSWCLWSDVFGDGGISFPSSSASSSSVSSGTSVGSVMSSARSSVSSQGSLSSSRSSVSSVPSSRSSVSSSLGSSRSSLSGISSRSSASSVSSVSSASSNSSVGQASVVIDDFAFAPATITVKRGTRVTWTNSDTAPHTVTRSGGSGPLSPVLMSGQSYSFLFNTAGTYPYFCLIHPSMTGSVIVTP